MMQQLIVYAKYPLPGHAKTRLGKDIGMEQAAGVYARLLYEYLLNLLSQSPQIAIQISVASPADVPFFAAAFPELEVCAQVTGDLGQRMSASFTQAFARGAERVVLTGSDIPGLDGRLVTTAFARLTNVPVIVGPARDGGYYLMGMRAPGFALFDGIAWSTEHVLAQTERLAQAQGLTTAYLPELDDIDKKEELERWQRAMVRGLKGAL